ncbi:MAG: AraC family transcriptional regulator [Bacteroidota bacterium]
MIISPTHSSLQKHIDYYWIVNDVKALLGPQSHIFAYPGITPDMLIVLEGNYSFQYMGETFVGDKGVLFSFIYDQMKVDFSSLKSFILIKFKSRSLSSLRPFVDYNSEILMKNSVANWGDVFGTKVEAFRRKLARLDAMEIASELDEWFLSHYKSENEGFVVEMAQELGSNFSLQTLREVTQYSYSTLERYFKKETGLTPKKFQSLQRYKQVAREICTTRNTDWQYYVTEYDYFDQSHFIKEIKRYTSLTPTQLLEAPSFIGIRPM